MDASQRLLLVTETDGLTSVAASLAASGTTSSEASRPVPNADGTASLGDATSKRAAAAGIAGTYAESAAYVGMRTQTIQLLRDGLYRACEAYMNGAIDETQYNMLLANMPKTMAALVAMDGLTGRPSAPPVVVNAPVVSSRVVPGADGVAATGEVIKTDTPVIQVQTMQTVDTATPAAVKAIALSVTEHPTLHGVCVSMLASHPDADELRLRSSGDPGYRAVLDMCRGLFKDLPRLYAEKARQKR